MKDIEFIPKRDRDIMVRYGWPGAARIREAYKAKPSILERWEAFINPQNLIGGTVIDARYPVMQDFAQAMVKEWPEVWDYRIVEFWCADRERLRDRQSNKKA